MRVTEGHTIVLKLVCFLAIPAVTPFVSLLKPLQASGIWPNGICWLVTGLVSLVGVANAGLAFSSGSFAKWQANANGTTTTDTASTTSSHTVIPAAPTPVQPAASAPAQSAASLPESKVT